MDEEKDYIIKNYLVLMTFREKAAHKAILVQQKTPLEGTKVGTELNLRFGATDPEVKALVEKGLTRFLDDVVERILREQADRIFFNRCPKCQALARTPTAKQCPKCFYSWHDSV